MNWLPSYHADLESMSKAAARLILRLAQEHLAAKGTFSLALSGGSSPRALYQTLTMPGFRGGMPWSSTHIFFSDERFVPPDHKDSNYRMAYENLIYRTPLKTANVHRVPTQHTTPSEAAETYEQEIRGFFAHTQGTSSDRPLLDLTLLGMGTDGHTASLFPGDMAVMETERFVLPVYDPQTRPFVPRITMTLPLINRSRCVAFIISGAEKRRVLLDIVEDKRAAGEWYPAALVEPIGQLEVFYHGDHG
jgi:6-phosphogluconolactonase